MRASENSSVGSCPFLRAVSHEGVGLAPSARAPRDFPQPIFLLSELLGFIQEQEQEERLLSNSGWARKQQVEREEGNGFNGNKYICC